jgi:hypothetical protein
MGDAAATSGSVLFGDLSDDGRWLVAAARRAMLIASRGSCDGVAFGARVASAVTALLVLAARDARRPLRIQPPCAGTLSADEEHLARALECCAAGASDSAAALLAMLVGRAPSQSLRGCLSLVHTQSRFSAIG